MQLKQIIGRKGSLREHLIRGASGSFILKIFNTALTLILAVILARVLGVENFGIYAFCLSLVQILTVPAMLGGQQLLVREIAAYRAKGEYHFLRGLLLRFRQASFLVSLVLALAGAAVGYFAYRESAMFVPFLVAMAILPLHTAMQLQGSALRGLRRVLLGQAALMLRPGLVILLVGGAFWFTGKNMGAEAALIAQLKASAVLVTLTFFLLGHSLPKGAKTAKPAYETSRWAKSMLPFVFASGMQILNKETSVVLLGIMETPEDVGLFRVAQRGALLIAFGLQAVNMAMAPAISELSAKGEIKRLQRMISKSIIAVLAFALPVALALIFGGKWIIPFVFGPDYSPAYIPLVILCIGQIVNAGMGSVGVILNMVGLERFNARGMTIAALISLFLNFILIPLFGILGAAIATSASLVIWNVLLYRWLYRETGIVSTIRRRNA